jgi:hypothetical protein
LIPEYSALACNYSMSARLRPNHARARWVFGFNMSSD